MNPALWFVIFFGCSIHEVTFASIIRRSVKENGTPPLCDTNNGAKGRCIQLVLCQDYGANSEMYDSNSCVFLDGPGVCCPNQPISEIDVVSDAQIDQVSVPFRLNEMKVFNVNSTVLEQAMLLAKQRIEDRKKLEEKLIESGYVVRPNTAAEAHQFETFADPISLKLSENAMFAAEVFSIIKQNFGPPNANGLQLKLTSDFNQFFPNTCFNASTCSSTKYRSMDGSCNNMNHQEWGKSFRSFQRMMPPIYSDGISVPPVASDGTALPNAHAVGATAITRIESPNITELFTAFGEFVRQDISIIPPYEGSNGGKIFCCPKKGVESDLRHPECFPIEVTADEPCLKNSNVTCMEYVRSTASPPSGCELVGPREQLNVATAFIDGSMIYGSSEAQAKKLSTFEGGKLKDFHEENTQKLSQDVHGKIRKKLSNLYKVFIKLHNKITDELAKSNPTWDDATLYQEARRIVGAILQRITYNEFLPILLGSQAMKKYELNLANHGFWNNYDSALNPTIYNELSVAAFPINHLMKPADSPSTNEEFCNELAATTIQRARDHAIGTYTEGQKICQSEDVAESFEDLKDKMDTSTVDKLSKLYKSVDDVDLWVGGINEKPIPGSNVGATFSCIIGEQFRRLRKADRYWHEGSNSDMSFSEDQLKEIRKISLSRLLCDHGEVKMVPAMCLLKPVNWNPEIPCTSGSIPKMDFTPWKAK